MTDKEKIRAEIERLKESGCASPIVICDTLLAFIDSIQEESAREDYEIYGSVAAVKALDRKRVCPQLKGNTLHKFKNEFNTIKQIVHLLYDYEDPFCYRVALHWASWGAYNLKNFGNMNEKEKAKMDISEEPVSEELEEAAEKYGEELDNVLVVGVDDDNSVGEYAQEAFKAGVKWQAEEFEKNRLKHCNSITNEQAELEQGFIDQHLDKHQRMPTFLDAIEYGYLKAEKDLELTWEDMFNIFRLVNEVFDDYAEGKTKKEIGEEVLRRFKERRI